MPTLTTKRLRQRISPFVITFAQTDDEVQKAQRLRHLVFCNELGAESSNKEIESDRYDQFSDHLLIMDESSNEVIGTYRMQTLEAAERGNGFYTNQEFYCDQFPDEIIKNAVEIGRLCIHPDYRSRKVLIMLWKGLAMFLEHYQKRYLFGCCSVLSTDIEEAEKTWRYFHDVNVVHPTLNIDVRDAYKIPNSKPVDKVENFHVQQLISVYLRFGAQVCSPPALDKEFKTIDFLTIFDTKTLKPHQRVMFFGNNDIVDKINS